MRLLRILGVAGALFLLIAPLANAKEFRIRKTTLQENHLLIYHEPVDTGDEASVTVGGQPCELSDGDAQAANRGGDDLTTLIVIDRGGRPPKGAHPGSDMARYSPAIEGAVSQFIQKMLEKSPGEKFALKEAPGRGREGDSEAATSDQSKLDGFLSNLKPPAGAGADIYGTTHTALRLLRDTDTPLRAVIIISDGLDPMRKGGDTESHPDRLVRSAQADGVPISAIHIDRSQEGRNMKQSAKPKKGRRLLTDVVERTHGEFRSVQVGDGSGLQERVLAGLQDVAAVYGKLVRTKCRLCGDHATARQSPVDLRFGEDRSRSEPKVLVNLPATNFGDCEGASAEDPPVACEADVDCEDANLCHACLDGTCESPECEEDKDCFEGCSCQDGPGTGKTCQKAKTLADHLPLILGIIGLLAAILIGVGLSRKQRRAQEAMQAEMARRDAEAKQQAEAERQAAEQRAAQEAQQNAAKQAELQRQIAQQENQVAAMADQLNPLRYKLVSGDGSGAIQFEIRTGSQIIGGDPGRAQLVIDAPTVSGAHATLSVDEQGVASLMDNGSSNGTFLNDFPLQPNAPVEVRPGDVIALSRQVLLTLEEP